MENLTPNLILVPTDFSPPAAHALRYAAALGARFGAHLLVVHADSFVPPVDFTVSAGGTFGIAQDDMVEAAREQLQAFAETNIGPDMPYDVRVVVGAPIDAILAQVRETGADLIVMGTHGRTGLRRMLFGSVTEAVMRLSPVPVIEINDFAPETAGMQVIIGSRSSPEARAAVQYAGLLADVENARFIEIGDEDDVVTAARREGADLIAMGVSGDRRGAEYVMQHSACPVLTVSRVPV